MGMNANLDRESTTSYTLTLTATDQGSDQMSSSIELTVILADVNDNIPDFAVETYTARVAEVGRHEEVHVANFSVISISGVRVCRVCS